MHFRAIGIAAVLPGLAVATLIGLSARALHQTLPDGAARLIGEVLLAVLLGLLVGNFARLPAALSPGIRFSFHVILRWAIVLLGAAFSLQQVLAIGGKALILIVILMSLALGAALWLGGITGVPRRLAALIGIGTAVCGNSAIVAAAPVMDARDDEVSFAIATNTLFGTLAVLFYPLLGRFLGMDDPTFGTWAGTAVNDTSQVVATGFAYSDPAGRVATAVKLTRNALLPLVVVAAGLLHARGGGGSGGRLGTWERVGQSFPLFVVGFLVMAVLGSLGILRRLSEVAGFDLHSGFQEASRAMILIALAGVGLSTRVDSMRRTGARPLWLGLLVAGVTSAASLLLIRTLGPAAG